MNKTKIKKELARQACILDLGGFRPPEEPSISWFGKVNLALANETWPEHEGEPMVPICQINLKEMPFVPPVLSGLEMITLFVGEKKIANGELNGTTWCLRAYTDISALKLLSKPLIKIAPKALPMKGRLIKADYPTYDHLSELGIPISDLDDDYEEDFINEDGFKLGGWPATIQCAVDWPQEGAPEGTEFAFQIASTEKGNWQWGDNGTVYLGRKRNECREDSWHFAWQCY